MSQAATITVYVKLLDEGTDVMRPTLAIPLGESVYELLPTPDYNPENETWEFLPGTNVEVSNMNRNGKVIPVATAKK